MDEALLKDWTEASRVTELERRVDVLAKQLKLSDLRSKWLAIAFLGLASLFVFHMASSLGKQLGEEFRQQLRELVDPATEEPFYMMLFSGLVGTLIALKFIGAPKTSRTLAAERVLSKNCFLEWEPWASMAYQFATLLYFLYGFYVLFHDSYMYVVKHKVLQSSVPTIRVILSFTVIFTRTPALLHGGIQSLALFQLYVKNMNFVRNHSEDVRNRAEGKEGNGIFILRQMQETNGPIVMVFLTLTLFVCWPVFLFVLFPMLAPICASYFWFYVPLCLVCSKFMDVVVFKLILKFVQRNPVAPHPVNMYEITMYPLPRNANRRDIEVIQQTSNEFTDYYENLDLLFSTGLTRGAWLTYLKITVIGPVFVNMLCVMAVRYLSGEGYMEPLWSTIAERHYYTYFNSFVASSSWLLRLLGLG